MAMCFYRDTLRLPIDKEWHTAEGKGVVFLAGQATLEIVDVAGGESIDLTEVGRVMGERVRLAMRVEDVDGVQTELTAAGAELLGVPIATPWGGRNARVRTPDEIQLTPFRHLDEEGRR